MSKHTDCNASEQYPTYYSPTESGQPVLDVQLTLDRQRRREMFIKENQHAWWVTGQQYRYVRKSMYISHCELAKCLGLSPSVILAFEEGKPIQRPNFVEGAYRTALTSIFYSYSYLYPCYKEITLKDLQELVDTFNFR